MDLAAAAFDLLQIAHLAQKHRLWQIAQAFGDPEPDIGCAGNQGGIGVLQIPAGEVVAVIGAIGARDLWRGEAVCLPGPLRGYLGQDESVLGHLGGDWAGFGGLGGADDRGVAGAAAEVACKHGVVICAPCGMGHGHRDDEAGGAKTALAAVVVDHGRLHRMWGAVGGGEAFDGAHGFAVQLRQEQDAGVKGTGAVFVGDHDGAGAAVALIAALFGAVESLGFAQEIKKRPRWGLTLKAERRSIQEKRDFGHGISCRGLFGWPFARPPDAA